MPRSSFRTAAGNSATSSSGSAAPDAWTSAPDLSGPLGTAPYLALYRPRVTGGESLQTAELVLLDFVNAAADGVCQLSADLDPGLYAIRVRRSTDSGIGFASVFIDTPTPRFEELVLDPNFGYSDTLGLRVRDFAAASSFDLSGGTNLFGEYRQSFYRVVAPAGSQSGLTAFGVAEFRGARSGPVGLATDHMARLRVWKDAGFVYSGTAAPDPFIDPVLDAADILHDYDATVGATLKAIPGESLYITLNRDGMAGNHIRVMGLIQVPFSGTPDLVVMPIDLSPNNGETRVAVTTINVGYAPAIQNTSLYGMRDDSKSPALEWTYGELFTPTLGPFGASDRDFNWDPVTRLDDVSYEVDSEKIVDELSELNNKQERRLRDYDLHDPQVTVFELDDPDFDGTLDATVWGRYVRGVHAEIPYRIELADGDDDIYRTYVTQPVHNPYSFTDTEYTRIFYPAAFQPTHAGNPNEFVVYTKDIWGVESERVIRTVKVVPKPGWLQGEDSSIEFDEDTHTYQIHFRNNVIDFEKKTGNLILGDGEDPSDLPFIGDTDNKFFVGIAADAVASLNPDDGFLVPPRARALLTVLGQNVFDVSYDGSTPINDHISIVTNIIVNGETLEADAVTVGLKIVGVDLFDWQSPEIKVFSYGIPGIASLNAYLQFGVDLNLNAGVTLALDPSILQDPIAPIQLAGFASPTFVQPDLTLTASVGGEAELLGFIDIASIEVDIGLNVKLAFGLKTPVTQVIPFEDFFNPSNFGLELQLGLVLGFSFEILGFEVFGYNDVIDLGAFGDDVKTWDDPDMDPEINPLTPEQAAAIAASSGLGAAQQQVTPSPIVRRSGGDIVGPMAVLPKPNLLIDGPGGDALYVQVAEENGRGNLAFARAPTAPGATSTTACCRSRSTCSTRRSPSPTTRPACPRSPSTRSRTLRIPPRQASTFSSRPRRFAGATTTASRGARSSR